MLVVVVLLLLVLLLLLLLLTRPRPAGAPLAPQDHFGDLQLSASFSLEGVAQTIPPGFLIEDEGGGSGSDGEIVEVRVAAVLPPSAPPLALTRCCLRCSCGRGLPR